jgi:hypothetical protein
MKEEGEGTMIHQLLHPVVLLNILRGIKIIRGVNKSGHPAGGHPLEPLHGGRRGIRHEFPN